MHIAISSSIAAAFLLAPALASFSTGEPSAPLSAPHFRRDLYTWDLYDDIYPRDAYRPLRARGSDYASVRRRAPYDHLHKRATSSSSSSGHTSPTVNTGVNNMNAISNAVTIGTNAANGATSTFNQIKSSIHLRRRRSLPPYLLQARGPYAEYQERSNGNANGNVPASLTGTVRRRSVYPGMVDPYERDLDTKDERDLHTVYERNLAALYERDYDNVYERGIYDMYDSDLGLETREAELGDGEAVDVLA